MLRIYIITEGGRDIGIGHITRCISLCQAFEERGIKPEFVVNGDDIVRGLLNERKYQILNWLKEEFRLFKIIKGASIAIVDSYLADAKFYKRVSEAVEIPVYIDDNNRFDYPRGFIVNGTIYAEELYYQRREDTTYLLGSQYIPLRKEFWNVHEKEIKDAVESIMVTFGGDDSKNMTPRILKLLCENYPFFTKKIIIGKGFSNIDEIKRLKDEKTEFIYDPDAEGIKKIMLESDIAISAGGQTLYELAAVGVPTIGLCIADNQLNNLKSWQKTGFIEYAGWWKDKGIIENISACIKGLEDKESRLRMSLIGRRSVDGGGSPRVRDILLDHAARTRRGGLILTAVRESDCKNIWMWRNHPDVRKNSFDDSMVPWEDHKRWFHSKIRDKNTKIYIARQGKNKVGVIRFAIENASVKASVNLNPRFFGKGLGSELIRLGTEKVLDETKTAKPIIADIKRGNIVSQKAFSRADYKCVEETKELLVYKKEAAHA